MVECQSCGGRFEPVQADGMLYFHRCPPLSGAELAAAVNAGRVALPIDPVTKAPETPDVAVQRRVYERANLRDENVTGAAAKPGDDAPIVAAGAGVLDVVAIAEPAVVTVDVAGLAPAPSLVPVPPNV